MSSTTMLVLTREMILDGRTAAGSWTRKQLELIGVDWPPTAGWMARAAGRAMTRAEYDEFVEAKNFVRSRSARHKRALAAREAAPGLFDDVE